MRALLIGFLILSPFIAIAQNFNMHTPIPLSHPPGAHLAHEMAACASTKIGDMVNAFQALLG